MTIFIQSRHDGFRRCGVAHTVKGQEFPDDYFTKAQLKQLNEDPEITMVAGMPAPLEMKEKTSPAKESTVSKKGNK